MFSIARFLIGFASAIIVIYFGGFDPNGVCKICGGDEDKCDNSNLDSAPI